MYEATEKRYKGNRLIEILDDGEPFGADLPTKEHFSFGIRKARMVVAFMDEIAVFAGSDGAKPSITREIEREVPGLGSCTCVKETEFEVRGDTIERPYLELSAGSLSIGFGVTKAEALLEVEEDLERVHDGIHTRLSLPSSQRCTHHRIVGCGTPTAAGVTDVRLGLRHEA